MAVIRESENAPLKLFRERLLVQKNVRVPEIPVKPVLNLANAPYSGVDFAVPGQYHKSRVGPSVDGQCPVLSSVMMHIHTGGYIIVVVVIHFVRVARQVRGEGGKRRGPAIVFVSRLQYKVEADLLYYNVLARVN